ncbi:MAG: RNA 2',3'-cyclic phosphodiesterase [Pseudomonadota bacterium]
MRLFIAVPLPDETRDALIGLQDKLRGKVKRATWVRRSEMHVTLRFLGDCDDDFAPEVGEMLAEALTEHRPFEALVKGGGAFPNPRRPKVFWVGMEDGGGFASLAHVSNLALAALGLPAPAKPFQPHITLCRLRGPWLGGLPKQLEELKELGRFQVDRLVLFKSDLHPIAPQHTELRSFMFK